MLKFYYNGIKSSDKQGLQKAHFNFSKQNGDKFVIDIYARDYVRFSEEVRNTFTVKNDSDIMTDYFECDRIEVPKNHPLIDDVIKAIISGINKNKYFAGKEEERKANISNLLAWKES